MLYNHKDTKITLSASIEQFLFRIMGSPKLAFKIQQISTIMEYCDTFIREKHIDYIIKVGNEKDTLTAVVFAVLAVTA